ncbi:MAG TPA: sigma-70 family RNA polymerase sigma factor [Ktedonobacterales bacterium]|jgi:RNA polymerase sigma-70 factor (ECF subfamily)
MSFGKGAQGSNGNMEQPFPQRPEDSGDAEALFIARSRRGDTAAFDQLILLHQQAVYTLAYRMLGDPDNAADVTQEALFSAYRAIASFRGGSFRSWLLRIASNACCDYWRRSRRHPGDSLEALSGQSEGHDEGLAQQFAADERWNPETLALRVELQELIQEGLVYLPLEQRLAVILSDIQGLSYEEIASATGASLGTVKSRIARGRAQLRDYLQRHVELLPRNYRLREEKGRETG